MSLHLHELVDPDVVDAYLFHHLTHSITDEAVTDARSLAEEGLSFANPPAGAHAIAARLAELEGDLPGLHRHVHLALGIDPAFGPALEDLSYVAALQTGAGRRAGAARRAELLFHKADRWSGRPGQHADTVALAGRVLGVDDPLDHPGVMALVSRWQFLAFLLFEGGLLARFEAECAPLLSGPERALLASWRDVGHRLVRLERQRGRCGRFSDLVSGEELDVTVLHEQGCWAEGRVGLAVLVPADSRHVLVGEPVLVDGPGIEVFRRALGVVDPLAIATACLSQVVAQLLEEAIAAQDDRLQFVLPGADPATFDFSESGVMDHLREQAPELAWRADSGDIDSERQLLLDAIVAHRVITLHQPHTWRLASQLLDEGHGRDAVLQELRDATYAELVERARVA